MRCNTTALTKCVIDDNVFICDVSITNGKILIHNVPKDVLYEVRIVDVVNVYRQDSALVIITPDMKILINISGTSSSIINEVGRVVELRIRYEEFSKTIKDLLLNTAKALQAVVGIVRIFGEDYVDRWVKALNYVGELYEISKSLKTYGIDVEYRVDELSRNISLRSVGGVKKASKDLIFVMVHQVEEHLRSLLTFEDLRPLINLIVLAYSVELAHITNQPVETKKAEEDLIRECRSEVYVKMLNKPELDLCISFIEDLRSRGSYEAIKSFLDNYLRLLHEVIRRLT
ncbi:MAG: hypothetical protein QXY36_00390 [Sulfolobales archaeon]